MNTITRVVFAAVVVGGLCGEAIGGETVFCIADINEDTFNGDPSGDGVVDSADFGTLAIQFGDVGAGLTGDLDADGVVGQSDMAILLNRFGTTDPFCQSIAGPGAVLHSAIRVDNSSVRVGGGDLGDPAFDGGITHFTFEIDVSIGGNNTWTTASMDFAIIPGAPFTIYQSLLGGDATKAPFPQPLASANFDTAVQTAYGVETGGPLTGFPQSATDFNVPIWFSKRMQEANHEGLLARLTIVRSGLGPDPIIVRAGQCPGAIRIASVEIRSTAGFTDGELHTDAFEIIESPLVSDLNGDLVVDTADLGIMIANFGTDHPYSDVNNDGIVDTADLGTLIGEFGQECQ